MRKHQLTYYAAEISKTERAFVEGSQVLEIGFGNGSFLNFASKNDWKVVWKSGATSKTYGINFSPEFRL